MSTYIPYLTVINHMLVELSQDFWYYKTLHYNTRLLWSGIIQIIGGDMANENL